MSESPGHSGKSLGHSRVGLREWDGVSVFRSLTGPGVFAEHAHPEVQVSVRVARDGFGIKRAVSGSVSVVASNEPHGGRLDHPAEFVLFYYDPERLAAEAESLGLDGYVGVATCSSVADSWLESVAIAMHGELEHGATEGVVAESLALATRTRVLCSQSSVRPRWSTIRPLTVEQLRQAVLMLDEGLGGSVTVEDIARRLGYGVSMFGKAFRATVGTPPHRYLMRLRIERAERRLRESTQALSQIALDCGFASQSHMTEHLRRFRGLTPLQYRERHAVSDS